MHWKTKSKIQNTVSLLPPSMSYSLYYWIQRKFGGLKNVNPINKLTSGIEVWKVIQELNIDPVDKTFFEIGTGRDALVPLAYWLMGAKKIITIDKNPYIKSQLIKEHLEYISCNKDEINNLFGPLLYKNRLEAIVSFYKKENFSIDAYFKFCNIKYIAPGDAANSGLENNSIDFHSSYVVFEHIPRNILKKILKEGNRIINNNGVFIHKIDYSDHFSYSDKSISAINFLQYSDSEWSKYAGNRYMYMNRMRHDDFLELFEECGHELLLNNPYTNEVCLEQLSNNNLKPDTRFTSKSAEILSITSSWIISKNPH